MKKVTTTIRIFPDQAAYRKEKGISWSYMVAKGIEAIDGGAIHIIKEENNRLKKSLSFMQGRLTRVFDRNKELELELERLKRK